MSANHTARRRPRPPRTPPVIEYDEAPCPNPSLEGPCHIFRGARIGSGYGNVGIGRKSVLVHRYVWERDVGPIPPGLVMDHQCMTRACCNVKHLRVVTFKVNCTENSGSVGAVNKVKTCCPFGHEFTPENTRVNTNGSRVCRVCRRRQNKGTHERQQARRAANGLCAVCGKKPRNPYCCDDCAVRRRASITAPEAKP